MTKARDTANLVATGVPNSLITLDAAEIPNISTDKLTTGTLANARVADLPTSKITSGTFADARISASSVTQHAATYDDNKLQSNIALLGFKTAVNGSLAKYNLQDQIIDEYTDATGVDASASTNETLTAGVYAGATGSAPTNNADTSATDGSDTVLKWTTVTASGNLQFTGTTSVEYLIVAGGAAGGYGNSGGGGAGAYLANGSKALSLTGGNAYTITVGAGGVGDGGGDGNDGSDSIMSGTGISTLTADGGGGGSRGGSYNGVAGGSGGGGGYNGGAGGAASGIGTGFAGGGQTTSGPEHGAAGGGGAGAVGANGTNSVGGVGGVGLANDITGASVYYAGGGGGSSNVTTANSGAGGNGGGGAGASKDGTDDTDADATANTGGGGGGTYYSGGGHSRGGHGGSGIVIIRFVTVTAVGNLTLQSTDTTASTANPDYADMVMLMENTHGTATLNTDIKGYISEDSGVTFTQGTLVDEGTWGTNKKILAFHDLDISAQTGSAMCYKITTHNQSAGVKETKIHATSIGWR